MLPDAPSPYLLPALLATTAATWYMVGLIALVQGVHYPLFRLVGAATYAAYQRRHMQSITPWVFVPMGIQAVGAGWLALVGWPGNPWVWVGAGCAAGVWGLTAAVFVPLHTRLLQQYHDATHRQLVRRNWLRTALWLLHGLSLGPLWWAVGQAAGLAPMG